MSTLNVQNITDGTNTTSAAKVVNGSASAWAAIKPNNGVVKSYGVSSYTDDGVGLPQFNFTSAFPDNNYCAVASCTNAPTITNDMSAVVDSNNTSNCRVVTTNGSTFRDTEWVYLAVFNT